MLALLYNMTASESMRYCQYVHDLRECPMNVGSPQTLEQRHQVCDTLFMWCHGQCVLV